MTISFQSVIEILLPRYAHDEHLQSILKGRSSKPDGPKQSSKIKIDNEEIRMIQTKTRRREKLIWNQDFYF